MKKNFLALAISALVFVAGCAQKNNQDGFEETDFTKCFSDQDCILVGGGGCCPCPTAINKNSLSAFEDYKQGNQCEGTMGIDVFCSVCPPIEENPKCENNECKIVYQK